MLRSALLMVIGETLVKPIATVPLNEHGYSYAPEVAVPRPGIEGPAFDVARAPGTCAQNEAASLLGT